MTMTKKSAIRDGFGKALLELGKTNEHVVALSADLTESLRVNWFSDRFPKRFIQTGICEQNMMGMAAGLAHAKKIPFVCSFAVFNPGRNWDQLRVSVCYTNENVKIIGGHAGLTVGEDGASHQALEDIAITRCLPNLVVLVPCDENQMYHATLAAARYKGPVYLRNSRYQPEQVTHKSDTFTIGKIYELTKGKDVTVFACGILVQEALKAYELLKKEKISVQVINVPTIKPLDDKAIVDAVKKTKAVVTCEEHQIIGGLGSAISECLSKNHPTPIEMVGIKDTFGESGPADELLDKYHLRAKDIVRAVKDVLKKKSKR